MTLEYTKEECRLSLTSEDYIKPLCGCDIANRVIKFCSIHKAAPRMAEWIAKVTKQGFTTFPEDRKVAREIIQTLDLS